MLKYGHVHLVNSWAITWPNINILNVTNFIWWVPVNYILTVINSLILVKLTHLWPKNSKINKNGQTGRTPTTHGIQLAENNTRKTTHGIQLTEFNSRNSTRGKQLTESTSRNPTRGKQHAEFNSRNSTHGIQLTEFNSRKTTKMLIINSLLLAF